MRITNQVSEFSLILTTIAASAGIFEEGVTMIIALATLVTLFLSSIGHTNLDELYKLCQGMLGCIDRMCRVRQEHKEELALHNHVVLLGLNEIGMEVAEVYRHRGKDVLCIQLDPELHHVLSGCYKHGIAAKDHAAAQDAVVRAALGDAYRESAGVFYEGSVMKKGQINTAFKERFFRLQNGRLAYYKSAKDADNPSEAPIAALECAGMRVSKIPEPELVKRLCTEQPLYLFHVHVQSRASDKERLLECACESESERDQWCDAIGGAIEAEGHKLSNIDSFTQINPSCLRTFQQVPDASIEAQGHRLPNLETGVQRHLPVRNLLNEIVFEPEGTPASNIYSQYADPTSPKVWHHYELHAASLVVSCRHKTTESDCALARELSKHHVPFICVADSDMEAKIMYESGVTYVVQSEALAAKVLGSMLMREHAHSPVFFERNALLHLHALHDIQDENNNRRKLSRFL
jgi:hypothetical protein